SLAGPGRKRSSVQGRSLVLLRSCLFSSSVSHASSWRWDETVYFRNISLGFIPASAHRTLQQSGPASLLAGSPCSPTSDRLPISPTSERFLPSFSSASGRSSYGAKRPTVLGRCGFRWPRGLPFLVSFFASF